MPRACTAVHGVISSEIQPHDSTNSSDRWGSQGFLLLPSDGWGDFIFILTDRWKWNKEGAAEVDQGHENIHYQGKGAGGRGTAVQQWGSMTMKACSWEANGDNEEWNNERMRWNIHIRRELKSGNRGSKGKRTFIRIQGRTVFSSLLLLFHNLSHKPPKPCAAEKLSNKMSHMHLQSSTLVTVCGYYQGSFIPACKMEHQICFLAIDKALFHLEYQMKEHVIAALLMKQEETPWYWTLLYRRVTCLCFFGRILLILKELKELICLKVTLLLLFDFFILICIHVEWNLNLLKLFWAHFGDFISFL